MDNTCGSESNFSKCYKLHTACSASGEQKSLPSLEPSSYVISQLGEMKCSIKTFTSDLVKNMWLMKNNEMLTDVKLQVLNEVFHAHKVVLAAASPYFKAMFTSGLREKDASIVKLHNVCPTVMGKILSFVYTGEIVVNQLLVCQLLPAASMLQVTPVIQACCTFLENQLDPSNALGIALFAEQHGCNDLYRVTNKYIDLHFIQVCQEEEFLQLSPTQLVDLIRRDELNVREERDVYNAVLKWVRYDEDNRRCRMEDILRAVRCHYLSPSFLTDQMKNCDLLKKIPACREHLAKIFQELSLHKSPCVKQRTPSAPCVLYIVAGFQRRSLGLFERFVTIENRWTPLEPLPKPRSGLSGAILGGLLYAVGGRESVPETTGGDCRDVDAYNPATNQWHSLSPLISTRHRLGVAVLDGRLYAVGGVSGKTYLNTVERFNPEKNKWKFVAPMKTPRLGVAVAVVNRLLYAIGGYDGKQRLRSVECYHPEKNEWISVSPMKYLRSGAGAVAFGQYIYIVGGYNGTDQLSSVERYDTEKDEWACLPPLQVARSALTVAVLDKKIYAMGGFDGAVVVDVVEVYNPITNSWEFGPRLTCPRSGHASAVSCSQCPAHTAAFDS